MERDLLQDVVHVPLHLLTNTVKGHVHNILEKLALHTRLQIAANARSSGGSEVPSA